MYLVSACLCGVNCKYNGGNNLNIEVSNLIKEGNGILVCPEQLGGLTTPRLPCEIKGDFNTIHTGESIIVDNNGEERTAEFLRGANEVLRIAKTFNITQAILKEGSPSCGVNYIYDGSFSGNKINGMGITTYTLINNGIKVISENDFRKDGEI